MTEREDIYLGNFDQLCPLVKEGWTPLYPIGNNPQNINIVLTKSFGPCGNKQAEEAAATAVGLTCRDCVFAHSSPLTNTICFSNQGIPEDDDTTATVYVQVREMEV